MFDNLTKAIEKILSYKEKKTKIKDIFNIQEKINTVNYYLQHIKEPETGNYLFRIAEKDNGVFDNPLIDFVSNFKKLKEVFKATKSKLDGNFWYNIASILLKTNNEKIQYDADLFTNYEYDILEKFIKHLKIIEKYKTEKYLIDFFNPENKPYLLRNNYLYILKDSNESEDEYDIIGIEFKDFTFSWNENKCSKSEFKKYFNAFYRNVFPEDIL